MQTSVNPKGQPVAFAGLISDSSEVVDVISAWSEEATAEMAFGVGIVKGTADRGALLPSASTDKAMGVLAHSFFHSPSATLNGSGDAGDLGSTGIKPKGRLRLLRKGRIWVVVDKAVTSISPFSDRGFLRYTADGVTNPTVGAWGKATDAGKNLDLTAVALFVSSLYTAADGGKIAQLEVDFTNKP